MAGYGQTAGYKFKAGLAQSTGISDLGLPLDRKPSFPVPSCQQYSHARLLEAGLLVLAVLESC